MKYLSILAAIAALAIGPASAADLPVKAVSYQPAASVTWQGLYLDGYFQYGADITKAVAATPDGTTFDLANAPHGPGVGGSLGYNFDAGAFVLGARFDISYMNLTSSGQIGNGVLNFSNATNYLGNADVLLGLPLSQDRRLLGYVVGGFGFGGAKPNLSALGTTASIGGSSVGWSAGLGLRYKLPKAAFPLPTMIFIEGDYYHLGDKTLSITDAAGATFVTSKTPYHIVTQKIGLGWDF